MVDTVRAVTTSRYSTDRPLCAALCPPLRKSPKNHDTREASQAAIVTTIRSRPRASLPSLTGGCSAETTVLLSLPHCLRSLVGLSLLKARVFPFLALCSARFQRY